MEEYIGVIKMFAGNFAPKGWAFCDGNLLAISSYSALFNIIGTTYGGDGRTHFRLSDLRGRVPVGTGQGDGISPKAIGQRGGAETTTVTGTAQFALTVENLPAHTHEVEGDVTVGVADEIGSTSIAVNNVLAKQAIDKHASGTPNIELYFSGATATIKHQLGGVSHNIEVQPTGTGKPVSANVDVKDVHIMQPYLGISFIICTEGGFPSRP